MSKTQKTDPVAKTVHCRYVFIVDDRVIGGTNDLKEAIRLARKPPEAEIRDDYVSRDLKTLISHRR